MKNRIWVVLVCVSGILSACDQPIDNEISKVRQLAWNSISTTEQKKVIDHENAEVKRTTFDRMIQNFSVPAGSKPEHNDEDELYQVTFLTQDKESPVIIFVDDTTGKVIGNRNGS